jgi:hypothetical protein
VGERGESGKGEEAVGVNELLDEEDVVVTDDSVVELDEMIDDGAGVGALDDSLPDTGSRSLSTVLGERVTGVYLVDGTA